MPDDWGSWLQSLMANQGASQPNGGAPTYGAGPGGVLPGGGVMNYPAATPGAPSMGYPAMSQPGASPPQPAANALGSSLTAQPGAPPWLQFGGFHPGNILQGHAGPSLGRLTPQMIQNWASQPSGVTSSGDILNPTPEANRVAAPAPIDPYGLARGGAAPIDPFTLRGPSSPAGTATAPAAPMRAAAPAPRAIPGSPAAAGSPDLGYSRFAQIDRPNAPASGGPYGRGGPPQMSALNLAGLFGRGPQPGVGAPQGQPSATPSVPGAPPSMSMASNGPTPYGPNSPRLNPSGNLVLAPGQGANAGQSAPVPMPPTMPAGVANQRVANAIRGPNWWQNV